jgi:transposase
MSLKPGKHEIPEETRRVARAIFPNGNRYMRWYDESGELFHDDDFAHLYASAGQTGWSPAKLCMITLLQFAENRSDRQMAEAVQTRIDWKYLLGMELTDPGFHYSVLSEFRGRGTAHING